MRRSNSPTTYAGLLVWSCRKRRPGFQILTECFELLGHRVHLKWHSRFGLMLRIESPKQGRAELRYMVKQMTKRATSGQSLLRLLQKLNPDLRGRGKSLLHRGKSDLCESRLLRRRPHLALADEEAPRPKAEANHPAPAAELVRPTRDFDTVKRPTLERPPVVGQVDGPGLDQPSRLIGE